jgi:hypothetical protein
MYVSILSLSFNVKFICEYFRKRAMYEVVFPSLLVVRLGTLQNGIRYKICLLSDDAPPIGV